MKRSTYCRIRCKACDWTYRVPRIDAGKAMLYHRDVSCPKKVVPPSSPVRALGKWDRPHVAPPRFKGGRTTFCATCRGELAIVNDARSCPSGCTTEAIRV